MRKLAKAARWEKTFCEKPGEKIGKALALKVVKNPKRSRSHPALQAASGKVLRTLPSGAGARAKFYKKNPKRRAGVGIPAPICVFQR